MRLLLVTTLLLACATGATGSIGCASTQRGAPQTDDNGIARLIARRFEADPRLCPFAISVAVHKRTARLQGKVASEADRRRAAQLATEAGAAQIEDYLIIDPTARDAAMC